MHLTSLVPAWSRRSLCPPPSASPVLLRRSLLDPRKDPEAPSHHRAHGHWVPRFSPRHFASHSLPRFPAPSPFLSLAATLLSLCLFVSLCFTHNAHKYIYTYICTRVPRIQRHVHTHTRRTHSPLRPHTFARMTRVVHVCIYITIVRYFCFIRFPFSFRLFYFFFLESNI